MNTYRFAVRYVGQKYYNDPDLEIKALTYEEALRKSDELICHCQTTGFYLRTITTPDGETYYKPGMEHFYDVGRYKALA
jgi:hypothetical protein